jgi:hypothetical protein
MKEKLIKEYKSQNEQRNPDINEINRLCFEKMIAELNRCFNGTLHLIIKTGQDNTLAEFVYGDTAIVLPHNVIIYDAFYKEEDKEQKSSIDEILRLSQIEEITKKDKYELHRLKSLDDHMLMVIASRIAAKNNGNFTIVSRDKYREIRKFNRELPNTYSICKRENDQLTYEIINPKEDSISDPLEVLLRNENLYLYILAPVINKYGEIILFAKYTNKKFEYESSQIFMLSGKKTFMQNLFIQSIELLESIRASWENDVEKIKIKDIFDKECKDKITTLNKLTIYNSITRPDCRDFPSIVECKNDIVRLQQKFNSIFTNKSIDDAIYGLLPGYVQIKHENETAEELKKQGEVLDRILKEGLQKLEEEELKSAESSITYTIPNTPRMLKKGDSMQVNILPKTVSKDIFYMNPHIKKI